MNLDTIGALLRERIGLDTESLGPSAVPQAVAKRMDALSQASLTAYARYLGDTPTEFAALAELLVVAETWFFRGGALFEYLARHIAGSLPPDRPFRILSAPCSTGEEPYSLAIALVEAGVPADRWSILGLDLSAQALAAARAGRYRGMAFRELPAALREQYFAADGDDWLLDRSIRVAVTFREANLLDETVFAGQSAFDLIVCRNLLIYFHDAARSRVLAMLERWLTPGGLLCLGHAEPWSLVQERFTRTGPVEFFLYQHGPTRQPPAPQTSSFPLTQEGRPGSPSPLAGQGRGGGDIPVRHPRPSSSPQSERVTKLIAPPCLSDARRLADTGDVDAALALCKALDAHEPPSAARFTLEGILHVVRRDPAQALLCFRKALYLEPDHVEALEHLLVLCQQQGDQMQAQLVRRRLERARAGGES